MIGIAFLEKYAHSNQVQEKTNYELKAAYVFRYLALLHFEWDGIVLNKTGIQPKWQKSEKRLLGSHSTLNKRETIVSQEVVYIFEMLKCQR